MKKVMLLAAMVAMVLAAAVPALAQVEVEQVGQGNVACVQTAVQNSGQVAVSAYGDATNINLQAISQECNIAVSQVNTVVDTVYATASATAPAVEYEYKAPAVQYQYASPEAELPSTGGSSLIALGAGVLLVAGGLLARRIVR